MKIFTWNAAGRNSTYTKSTTDWNAKIDKVATELNVKYKALDVICLQEFSDMHDNPWTSSQRLEKLRGWLKKITDKGPFTDEATVAKKETAGRNAYDYLATFSKPGDRDYTSHDHHYTDPYGDGWERHSLTLVTKTGWTISNYHNTNNYEHNDPKEGFKAWLNHFKHIINTRPKFVLAGDLNLTKTEVQNILKLEDYKELPSTWCHKTSGVCHLIGWNCSMSNEEISTSNVFTTRSDHKAMYATFT